MSRTQGNWQASLYCALTPPLLEGQTPASASDFDWISTCTYQKYDSLTHVCLIITCSRVPRLCFFTSLRHLQAPPPLPLPASPSTLSSHSHGIHARRARDTSACHLKTPPPHTPRLTRGGGLDASRWSLLNSRPRFSAVSRGRQTNTDATGTLRPQGTALTRSARVRQRVRGSHMAPRSSLPLLCAAGPPAGRSPAVLWLFSRPFHTRAT